MSRIAVFKAKSQSELKITKGTTQCREVTLGGKKTPQKKNKGLSVAEKQALVIEFRTKARKLSRSMLKKWQSRLDLEELDSVVDLSLCEAVRYFDPSRGVSFITFLYYHLKGNLVRSITAAASEGQLSRNAASLDDEAAINAGSYRGINAIEISEALCNQEQTLPYDALLKKQIIGLSQESRTKLEPLEKEVIERIYIKGQQLIDVASSLGYSRCHISRLKKKALEYLESDMSSRLKIKERPEAEENKRDFLRTRSLSSRSRRLNFRPVARNKNVGNGSDYASGDCRSLAG